MGEKKSENQITKVQLDQVIHDWAEGKCSIEVVTAFLGGEERKAISLNAGLTLVLLTQLRVETLKDILVKQKVVLEEFFRGDRIQRASNFHLICMLGQLHKMSESVEQFVKNVMDDKFVDMAREPNKSVPAKLLELLPEESKLKIAQLTEALRDELQKAKTTREVDQLMDEGKEEK